MQAYKLKGKIDSEGNLVIPQPTNLNHGEREFDKIRKQQEVEPAILLALNLKMVY